MKSLHFYKLLLLSGFLLALNACQHPPDYDNKPHLEFSTVESWPSLENGVKKDSLILVTRFEDGDGDLGLSNEDITQPPFNQQGNNINYFVDILIKKNGVFQTVVLPAGFTFNGRLFRLAPDGRVGPIEGDIRYSIVVRENPLIKSNDVLKFRVRVRDRAFRESNTVESDEVTVLR
ncbi:MAG: hypothetical protein JWQ14_2356 [Adhaeribacter sp.]|nr:hypothetical protein [Adhaeribacter sp.]